MAIQLSMVADHARSKLGVPYSAHARTHTNTHVHTTRIHTDSNTHNHPVVPSTYPRIVEWAVVSVEVEDVGGVLVTDTPRSNRDNRFEIVSRVGTYPRAAPPREAKRRYGTSLRPLRLPSPVERGGVLEVGSLGDGTGLGWRVALCIDASHDPW